jgi:hypothetical protein
MPDPNAPGDDWQLDDVDWFEQAPRKNSESAAGETPARQRSGLIPGGARDGGDQPSSAPERRLADIRRRRIAALAALALLLGCAVVIPLVVFGGNGNSVEQTTTPATTARTTTSAQTTTQARSTTTTTTTTSTTPSAALRVALPAGTALKRGDRGAAVTELQKGLAALGFATGRPDGTFGATTEAAVVDFQQSNNLPPDGIVGSDTVRLLNAALAKKGATG